MTPYSALQHTGLLKVAFDASAAAGLKEIVLRNDSLFSEDEPAAADVLLFGTDAIDDLTSSELFRQYRAKSFCITETDIPTFFMPGLYASNRVGMLTHARTRTIPYFLSLEFNANEEVVRLRDADVEKRYLYCFMGGVNSWARRKILKYVPARSDTIVEATDAYNHWSKHDERAKLAANRRYAQALAASKFVLCPRGCGLSSYRLFETMSLGVAPVIISDKWRPIDDIDWRFALFVSERHIRDLDRIVRSHENEWKDRGQAARAAYDAHVSRDNIPFLLHRQLVELLGRYSPQREAVMSRVARMRFAYLESYWAAYGVAKHAVLKAFQLGDIPFPFALHGHQGLRPNRGRKAS